MFAELLEATARTTSPNPSPLEGTETLDTEEVADSMGALAVVVEDNSLEVVETTHLTQTGDLAMSLEALDREDIVDPIEKMDSGAVPVNN